MKEKNSKRVFQEDEKATRSKTIKQKSYKREKYLGYPLRKIFGTILEVDQKRPQTNGPENKKTNDHE